MKNYTCLRLIILIFIALSSCDDYSKLPDNLAFHYQTTLIAPESFELIDYTRGRDILEKDILYASSNETVFALFPTEKLERRMSQIKASDSIIATEYYIKFRAHNRLGMLIYAEQKVLFKPNGGLISVRDSDEGIFSFEILFKKYYRQNFINLLDKEKLRKDAKKYFIDPKEYL